MPTTRYTAAWVLQTQNGIESLEFVEGIQLPPLRDDEILVKIHAASLNYRDLVIAKGSPGLAIGKQNLVPGSDGAGVVEAIGRNVALFRVGDKVCTHLTYGLSDTDLPGFDDIIAGLGQTVDGTLREYGVFHETSLVKMPSNLSFLEASTLPCSGLTAWNALFGLEGRSPKPGSTVLVQGSGGVSVAALQFGVAAGATVIATTSNQKKGDKLKDLGAQHVINYRDEPDWGDKVKGCSADRKGVHIVVDVGGASTLTQSLKAVRRDGLISAAGVLGGAPDGKIPTIIDCIFAYCTARGLLLGSRKQFDDMNRFIEIHDIRPALDETIFDMGSVKEAYAFLQEQKHFSKIAIRLC